MPVQIFGRGMDDDIEAGFDRALNPRRGKRVVANRNNFVSTRDFCDRLQIDQLEQRIARGLDPNHARVWLESALEILRVGKIDIGKIETGRTSSNFVEKTKCTAVKIVARDDVRAAVDQFERSRHCGEPRCEREPARAALQIGDAFFVGESGRINRACVIVAFVFARAFLHISGCCVYWRHDRAGGGIGFLPGVNRPRGKALLLFHVDLKCTRG